MRVRISNALLILASFLGYLEWGDNHVFLIEAERDLLLKAMSEPETVIHPFTILPFVGQLILLATVFQKEPSRRFTLLGISLLGLLLGFMFLIGALSLNGKIFFSTIPFCVFTVFTIIELKKSKHKKQFEN